MSQRLNKLDGKTWLRYSFSIWRDIKKNKEERNLGHPAMFPIQLAERLIAIYTKEDGEVVLDPFMGSGSVLIAAQTLGKRGIGFETNKEYVNLAKSRLSTTYKNSSKEKKRYKIFLTTANNMQNYLKPKSVDLCITSPPYWNILTRKRTADKRAIRNYGDLNTDLGNIEEYTDFLNALQTVFRKVYNVLKPGKHCIVVVMDIRKKAKFYPFHADLTNKLQEIGFSFEDIIIWDRQHEYHSMRPLGYPWVFRINKVHEYILIFKK